ALRTRFDRTGAQSDLDEAIAVGRAAVSTTPDDHPDRAGRLSNLGAALRSRFDRTGAQSDLDEAITTYVQAAEVGSGAPSVRIRAAWQAASLGAQTNTQAAAELLEKAVRLLPGTAPRRLRRGDQQHALGQFAGLASDAAALVLRADIPDPSEDNPAMRALRLLELGRGVLLSQALDTRSDLTDLHTSHPTLAARYVELRDHLDQDQAVEVTLPAEDPSTAPGKTQGWREDRHQLATAFEALVAEIRSQPGFETFPLPPEPDQPLRHAGHGPVVVVNVSRYGSDALLLTPDGITPRPLPDLAQDALIAQIVSFHQALDTAHDPQVSSDERIASQDTLSAVLEWLWDAAAGPILDKLGYQHTPSAKDEEAWPRVWWVPSGLLGLLPLHAAGYHRQPPGPNGNRRTVMDRVISSYTPTVRALGYAREATTASAPTERALIVAMPTTPGSATPLYYVADEAELVRQRLPGATLLIENPPATAHLPTKATVLAHLGGWCFS
ncbi:MAG: tetratricopeptide repeat protein, partial [Actinobacteria bacterium]|nr:tetratricopeptide repeat protein [Actinomycetota bacterium]